MLLTAKRDEWISDHQPDHCDVVGSSSNDDTQLYSISHT